jgi:hypothetical protein
MGIMGLGRCGTRAGHCSELAHFYEHSPGPRLVHTEAGSWAFELPDERRPRFSAAAIAGRPGPRRAARSPSRADRRHGRGPDPLLTALTALAHASGDGAALVLAGTRAAVERRGRPAWACAGVTSGGEVAVLVHGEAVALVSADRSPGAQVTASGSMIPVAGTFTSAVVTVRLASALRRHRTPGSGWRREPSSAAASSSPSSKTNPATSARTIRMRLSQPPCVRQWSS